MYEFTKGDVFKYLDQNYNSVYMEMMEIRKILDLNMKSEISEIHEKLASFATLDRLKILQRDLQAQKDAVDERFEEIQDSQQKAADQVSKLESTQTELVA